MRSSALVIARALVMLTFLVALPVVAIFGTAPWEAVRGFVLPTPAEEALPDAPPFRPLASATRHTDAPPAASLTPGEPVSPPQTPSTLPRGDAPTPEFAPREGGRAGFERPLPSPPAYPIEPPPWRSQEDAGQMPVTQPVAAQPVGAPPGGSPGPTGYDSTPYPAPGAPTYATPTQPFPRTNVDSAVQPARAEWPAGAGPDSPAPSERPTPASIDRPASPTTPSREGSDFQAVQQRLQALGATYYRLETWGQKNQFRFHCRMAVRENTHFARQFEATDPDPVLAMRRVLEQVEKWRTEHPLQP